MLLVRSWSISMAAILLATGTASCFDPVHSDAVDELGGETAGVPTGRTHRPGQPCRTCHGGSGPGKPEFSIAGTIYEARNSAKALEDVTVILTDSSNPPQKRMEKSNQAGNFYIEKDRWSPTFPVFVSLQYPREPEKKMLTRIGRNGGCAFCHYAPLHDRTAGDDSPVHMPPVYMKGK